MAGLEQVAGAASVTPAAAASPTASAVAESDRVAGAPSVTPAAAASPTAPAAAESEQVAGAGSVTAKVLSTTEVLPAAPAVAGSDQVAGVTAAVASVVLEGSVPVISGTACAAASAPVALLASGSQEVAVPAVQLASPSLPAPAVAGSASVPMVWTVELIREHGQKEQPKQPWSRSNEALKW